MNKPTHTLNPNTGREIQVNGVRFLNLLKHGFKYDEKLNRFYDQPLPEGTTKYVPRYHYRKGRRSTFPGRECYHPAIAPWLLVDQHTTSYSVTTIDHEAANG